MTKIMATSIMAAAMKDPEIVKAFSNPKLSPLTAKIMADPSVLADPMKAFATELAADPELAALAGELLPKLAKLGKPRTKKEASPYTSPNVSRSNSPAATNMYKNQADLPRLPLPSLEDTCELFLEVTQTVVNQEEYEETKSAVASFLKTAGPKLHAQLEKIDNDPANDDKSWFHNFHDDMYMEARFPTYIYKNPAGVMKEDILTDAGITGQINLSANLIAATLKFTEKIIDETLEPDVFKGFSLDMLQYVGG